MEREPSSAAVGRGKIGGMPEHWQTFGVCLLFHFIVPLLPFVVEVVRDGQIGQETLMVGSAVYVMAIGASSRNQLIFAISTALGLVYSLLFGLSTTMSAAGHLRGTRFVTWSVVAVVVFHLIERYNRHVIELAPYWEFMERRKK